MNITYDNFENLSDMNDFIHKMDISNTPFKVVNVETRGFSYRVWYFI